MAKARILVEGMIQGVGYRAFVKQVARFLKLRGLVRNLEDETVEIFCEGPREKIQESLKRIHIKGEPEDFMSVDVTEIKCFWEGESGYQEAWKTYRRFEIDYGVEEMDVFQESTLEDHEYGKLYFSNFRSELKEFRENTATSFQTMAEKYGDISDELKKFRQTIEKFFDQFLKERAAK